MDLSEKQDVKSQLHFITQEMEMCERRLAQLDREVRTNHIALEFCIENFDTNAIKYSDQTKELCKMRKREEKKLATLKVEQAEVSLSLCFQSELPRSV